MRYDDPMDELIDDLERVVPTPTRTPGRIANPGLTITLLVEKCLSGPPDVDPDDPEVQRDNETFQRAIRQLGQPPDDWTPASRWRRP